MLLSLVIIASTATFNAILSLSTLALYISYLIPTLFIAIKRSKREQIAWGSFTLGRYGLPINIFAIIYAIYLIIFLPFPPLQPVTWENMNYAGPVMGVVLIFALLDWFLQGKRRFSGPTVKAARD